MGNHRLISVNLNKSYGESNSNSGVSYGLGSGRGRGLGRVVGGDVSRPISRSGQKKLCVPPPLNLPSLRKQHLTSGSSTSSGGVGVGGVAAVPTSGGSSSSSWSKPSLEREKEKGVDGVEPGSVASQASVLRGEDFPSLKATVNVNVNVNSSVVKEKHKDSKQEVSVIRNDALPGNVNGSDSDLVSVSRLNVSQRPLQSSDPNVIHGDAKRTQNSSLREHQDGGDYFPAALPLVRLNPRSDWADDERDTSRGLIETGGGRDHGYSTTHAYWDIDFDWPRPSSSSFRPHKLGQSSSIDTREEGIGGLTATRDFSSGRRDLGHVQVGRHQGNRNISSQNSTNPTGAERDRYHSDSNRHKVESVPNRVGLRPSFSSGSKGPAGYNKHSFSRVEKPSILKDWDDTGFDGHDPLSSGIVGAFRKKKDANRLQDFHDPARESFEAELERVQKMQEQERQRIIEEQERVMEVARREQEERQRIAREQAEHQRRLEEEAREAVRRAEQEKIEALRRAEEQRIAREEERRRVLMEEERRKQAAKQKLLELEERIARRQAEAAKTDNNAAIHGVKDKNFSKADDFSNWEDGEKMVERITNTSSDSSTLPVDMESRSVREGSISFAGKGKPFTWRRDIFENGNNSSFFTSDHGNGRQNPRQDASVNSRSFPRKESYSGASYIPTRDYYQGGTTKPHMDDLPYCRNIELEADFHENDVARFDVGWGEGRGRGSSISEQFYQNSELDELYTYGRSRYPARQPRVLPPPSLSSVHRSSFSNDRQHSDSAAYEDGSVPLSQTLPSEPSALNYQDAHEEKSETLDGRERGPTNGEQELNRSTTPGCDSQCSLSVSSPPTSPTHLSHDNLDDSRDCVALSGTAESQDISNFENEVLLNTNAGKEGDDDDEEWSVENNEELQEQEEYDEDVGYHEEDEAHEVDDDNPELGQEFQDMHLGEKDSCTTDNMVLGFDQGVEVGMPNDEYEPSSNVDGSLYTESQPTNHLVEQDEEFEGCRDEQVPKATDSLSVTVEDTEKGPQGFVSDSVNTSHTSAPSDPVNAGNLPCSIVLPALQAIPTPVGVNSQSTSQAVTGSGPGTPVKLQFGLFSGPPLIPSPVPSIQIGSIQMPLQLHPQIGSSLTHMHAPQPPLFQIGQLGYPSPVSQGILPLGTPSMSFVQPNVVSTYPSNQRLGGPLTGQPVQDASSHNQVKDDAPASTTNNHHLQLSNQLNGDQGAEKEANVITRQGPRSNALLNQSQTDASGAAVEQVRPDCSRQVENARGPRNVIVNGKSLFNKGPESRRQGGPSSSHSASSTRDSNVPASQGQLPRSRQRRFGYTARNHVAKFSSHGNDGSYADANGFQRRPQRVTQRYEFRVRQTNASQKSSSLVSPYNTGSDPKSDSDPKSGLKKEISSKPKRGLDLEVSSSDQFVPKKTGSGIGEDKPAGKEASATGLAVTRRAEGSLKRNISSEDVDAPLQSGVVHVFDQPGIEAPSDDDDFIEVRSKRQMLNDRRELREKEIKARSSILRKSQRKSRPTQSGASGRNASKTSVLSSDQADKSVHTGVPNRGSKSNETPVFNNVISQTLAAISTHPLRADSPANAKLQTIKSPQTSSYPTGGGAKSDLIFDAQSKVVDAGHSSSGSWDNSRINQPVMALTQTQLEEAMKPVQFDKQVVSVEHRSSSATEPGLPSSSSVLASDSRFSSTSSPISCLLAGEKIQFGAVTSPTILPPSTNVSLGSKPPVSTQLNINISQSTGSSGNDSALLFEKERHSNELCAPLEDCEAEAEAAASAVAVAAIGNDEVVGNGVGGCSASISTPKGSGHDADLNRMTAGLSCEQQSVSQPKSEEGLSVTLPADLSIETPPVSLWPPLPSPHSSSGPMLSPFSRGPTSHFPFYDMNSMMGGPVFAFGTHEESGGAHSQPQKTVVPNSPPTGTWQHCHTCVDSFYRPPAGFTTPFISPPGGVQGPPHMVVYNHFAPVGQFGQVGLSYMRAAYIPSGKQPDWKHTAAPSDLGSGGDREINNVNVVSVQQRNATNMPTQVPHLAPGSPLLSMASPLPMFDVSSFQNSADPSAHPHWSQVQASPVSLIPRSMPMQQQDESSGSSQSNPFGTHHPLAAVNGLTKGPVPSNNNHPFVPCTNTAVPQFPDELRLGEAPAPTGPEPSGINKARPGNTFMGTAHSEGSGTKKNNPRTGVSTSHNHKAQLSAQQKTSSGLSQYKNYHQRGAVQRNGSGAEWSSRKMGYHGRNHSSGGERGFPPTKVKQIYVAKQSTTGSSDAAA